MQFKESNGITSSCSITHRKHIMKYIALYWTPFYLFNKANTA